MDQTADEEWMQLALDAAREARERAIETGVKFDDASPP